MWDTTWDWIVQFAFPIERGQLHELRLVSSYRAEIRAKNGLLEWRNAKKIAKYLVKNQGFEKTGPQN